MDDNKKKALAAALGQIEKQFGKGSVMRMGDGTIDRNMEAISTGSLSLDIALGIGGLPKGRVVEVYGPESSGKTTLTLHAIAQCQPTGGVAAFIDAEHARLERPEGAITRDADGVVHQPAWLAMPGSDRSGACISLDGFRATGGTLRFSDDAVTSAKVPSP